MHYIQNYFSFFIHNDDYIFIKMSFLSFSPLIFLKSRIDPILIFHFYEIFFIFLVFLLDGEIAIRYD